MSEYKCAECGAVRHFRSPAPFVECVECDGLAYRTGYENKMPEILTPENRATLRNASPRVPGDGRYFAVFGD
jgi:hypothetical protein